MNLESAWKIPKETIYAAALLHDITKWQQHAQGTPHNESAIAPSTKIMQECGFTDEEIGMICNAILHHRNGPSDEDTLARLLFRADKLSRACYACTAEAACHWSEEKKNMSVRY